MYNAGKKNAGYKTVNNHKKASSLRSAKATPKTKTKASPSKKSRKSSRSSFLNALFGPRMIQVYGVVIMLFSVLLMVSMVSYFCHHTSDYSHVTSNTDVSNLMGTFGAHLAYLFVDGCMGIFAVGFAFLFFIYGVRITFGMTLLPLFRTTIATFLTMAWLSVLLGVFCYSTDAEFVSGAFGNYFSQFLLDKTSRWATFLILLAMFFVILILCYNFSMKKLLEIKVPKVQLPNRENNKVQRVEKNRKVDGNTDAFVPESTDLPDLYITNKNELSDEYRGNVFHFESSEKGNDKEDVIEEIPDEKALLSKVQKIKDDEPSDVPFDVNITGGDGPIEKSADELFPDDEQISEEDDELENQAAVLNAVTEPLEDYDPRADLHNFQFPTIDLLNEYPAKEASEEQMRKELTENKNRIETTLHNFGIPIKRITATVGPTVTLYEIVPADGVRISKIKNLEDDIALSLSALGIRIIAPIPGRGTIGIEVPNKTANIVSMREVIASDKFKNNKYELPIALGKTISNEPFVVDLAKMPHLLMAGATGQGKSVGLNAIITSLLYTKHPSELKFVLVDPKKVEFTLYSAIEDHYLAKLPDEEEAIITDVKKVVRTLSSLCKEMDDRYDLLKLAKTRNIKEYNAKFCSRKLSPALGHRYLPYIVLIIDEFGDLIMTAGREVEMPIARLAQLARAIGIHLVIATQRPSVNIITGMIKANFPARIAFRVTSVVDSRTILDGSGANQLIGKGDMLISTGSDLIRLQCAFVDTPEVEKIANFIQEQPAYPEPFLLPDVPNTETEDRSADDEMTDSDEIDPLFMEAASLIVQSQQGSTSSIQRKMKLGYNRAGRIMDQLEEFGIVGPAERSGKPREVKVKTSEDLRNILQRMGLLSGTNSIQ